MRCEDALQSLDAAVAAERDSARRHVRECEPCQAATLAARVLANERAVPAPALPQGSFARALARAAEPPRVASAGRGFWLGTMVGGALAASVAVALTLWWVRPAEVPSVATNPQVRLAPHEVRAISVSLDSPEVLTAAEISVVLTGSVGLQGFDEQRELHWSTDLERGVNQLTLPLVALGTKGGGQVMVEVQHGDKRRTFVVDVQVVDAGAAQDSARDEKTRA